MMPFAFTRSAMLRLSVVTFAVVWASAPLRSQAPAAPKPEPDVLIFTDGEKLIGELKSAKGDSVTFKSDMAGEVTVAWSKIQELKTSRPFAVIPKDVKLDKRVDSTKVPTGNLQVGNKQIEVRPAAGEPRTVSTESVGYVVDQPGFEKALNREEGFLQDWGGAVTAGISLVEATQKARSFTGGISLVRAEPVENWLNPRSKTLFDFTASYGKVSQPGLPDIKTEIYHADGERDQYVSPNFFAFGQFAFDHNFSQGLDLQQTYGGGFGWTVIKTGSQEFDLKGSIDYIRQSFQVSSSNENLIGSNFAEIYTRKLMHGILFNEQIQFTPAWNVTSAYSATGTASLVFPVYKRFGLTMTALDTFLNNPPPGFKKNSFQFTTGLTYTLR
ncbi:MAG: DUF481 domain-containing protein [Bryobacteraceae bacterium]